MDGLGVILTTAVIWFWMRPDRAGAWAAKAKCGFKSEQIRAEREAKTKP